MSRLIDADALLAKWKKDCTDGECGGDCFDCQFPSAIEELENAPNIDAVTVVRCKDCDNWATEFSSGRKSLGNYRCICQEWSDAEDHRFTYTGENEYCSRGERREE